MSRGVTPIFPVVSHLQMLKRSHELFTLSVVCREGFHDPERLHNIIKLFSLFRFGDPIVSGNYILRFNLVKLKSKQVFWK